ncbi:MAG: S8 family serine peptidase [Bacteroidota bacterium]
MRVKHLGIGWLFAASVYLSSANVSLATTDPTLPADTTKKAPVNWFNLDQSENKVTGVSTEKAYQLLKNKPSKPVIVAVIDGGVDIAHEDLKTKLWVNKGEIAGNGVDDDKNGYVDDVNGWNFIGGKDGKNVNQDTYESTREYVRLKKKFGDILPTKVKKKHQADYAYYQKIKAEIEKKIKDLEQQSSNLRNFSEAYKQAKEVVKKALGKDTFTEEELTDLTTSDEKIKRAQSILLYALSINITEERFKEGEEYFDKGLKYGYNLNFDPRSIVGDNYEKLSEKYYGNNDVTGPDASHGTHVAGIIAADRNNALGMKGVADNVQIMAVRAVPNGDERDKDVANAIRYAADNGAQIINMSFGKDYSPNKDIVDKAISYAANKGVLLVHAAGNDGENLDTTSNFPTVKFGNTGSALKDWLEVGASSWRDSSEFVAEFSNYGHHTVDVFAPGVDIYSTTPHQGYKDNSGTSMAAPVTSGVAALLMSYFPNLSADQVRDIIVKSTVKYTTKEVNKPGKGEEETEETNIAFGELSKTGGVVNAYEAVKMAESLSTQPLSPANNR